MSVDDFIKIMLATGFTFSLVGISFQIMRLIGKFTASIQDLRKTFQNVSTVSDLVVEDYRRVRGVLLSIVDVVDNLQKNVLSPLKTITNILSLFGRKQEDEELENSDESAI